MTKEKAEEAIQVFKEYIYDIGMADGKCITDVKAFKEALDMALEALKQESKMGRWIVFDDRYNKCSKCGFHYDTWNNRTEGLPIIFNYCPSCGEKMEVKE